MTAQDANLFEHGLAVAWLDETNRIPGVNRPRFKIEICGNERESADDGALGNLVPRHHDGVGADRGVVAHRHVAGDQMLFRRGESGRNQRDQVVHEVIARAPDLDARRQTAEISEAKVPLGAPRDAAAGGDVRAKADRDARGEVAIVVDDRKVSDREGFRMPDA